MQTTEENELYAGADLHGNNVIGEESTFNQKRVWNPARETILTE